MLKDYRSENVVHLIHGFVGSGKIFFANKMARRNGAVVISIDELLISKYGKNIDPNKMQEYHQVCEKLMFKKAIELLGAGKSVILDHGFWKRKIRDHIRKIFDDLGYKYIFYNVRCSDKRWKERMDIRNSNPGKYDFVIDDNAVEKFKKDFQVMTKDEMCVVVDTY